MTDGLLVVDKPTGMTSHDVVGRCRRIVGQKRIGHSGTLDPGATGVLLVALGRATRLIRFLEGLPKSYVGEVVLGSTTTTLDNEGAVTATFDMSSVTLDDVQTAATKFIGDILQVPPMVSALKVNGKRLHELARDGVEVERKPRPVTIHSINVAPTDDTAVFLLSATVSSGTYVRTLAADIGDALGGGAHLRNLRRTAIGSFTADRAVTLEALDAGFEQHVLVATDMVSHLDRIVAGGRVADDVAHGRHLDRALATGDGPWAVVDTAGELLAVYEPHTERELKAGVVIASG